MMMHEAIGRLRRELLAYVEQRIAQLFGFTLTAGISKLGEEDEVQTGDETVSAPEADISPGTLTQRLVRRIEPWGFRGRPPDKVRALWLRLGSSNVVFIGTAVGKGYGPNNLEVGETSLYCSKGGTEIRLDKDGNIKITAASNQDVIVNGGNLKVARRTDPVRIGTLAGVSPSGAVTFTFTPQNADGVPGVPSVGATVTLAGVIQDGALHFKG